MHNIVIPRERGKASEYLCSEESCENDGTQWSWVHGLDPRDSYNYDPLCDSCHGKYDYPRKKESIRLSLLGNKHLLGYEHTEESRNKMSTKRQGERNAVAKLNDRKVRKMRELWETGIWPTRELAEMFDIKPVTAWRIVTRRSWRHI
jgi:hypothetical protein